MDNMAQGAPKTYLHLLSGRWETVWVQWTDKRRDVSTVTVAVTNDTQACLSLSRKRTPEIMWRYYHLYVKVPVRCLPLVFIRGYPVP